MKSQRCIWMDAKAIEYQLCPLKQNCDACDFYQEMLGGHRSHPAGANTALINLRDPESTLAQFHPGLQYIPGHFWYKRTGAGRIRLGIDAFLWQIFSSARKVLMPAMDTDFAIDQCFSWLLVEGGLVYLKTPFRGRVSGINEIFSERSKVNTPYFLLPEPELWFIELQLFEEDFQGPKILSHNEYIAMIEADQGRLQSLTHPEFDPGSHSLSRISQLTKQSLGRYLHQIGENRILIC